MSKRKLPFERIFPRYQLLNTVLSFGLDSLWRHRLVKELDLRSGQIVLDVGAGPGDILSLIHTPNIIKIGLDPETRMMAARPDIEFHRVQGIAEGLPFPDSSIDRIASAFAVRNFSDRRQGFNEFYRVLKPGGKGAYLEMSQPDNHLTGYIARQYIKYGIPLIGGSISGDKQAYQYLSRTVLAFPKPPELVKELEQVGFRNVWGIRLIGWVTGLMWFEKG